MKNLGHKKIRDYLKKEYSEYNEYPVGDKYYGVKYHDNKTAVVIFNDGRRIVVKYLYNEGRVHEIELESMSVYDKIERDFDELKLVELNKTEQEYLNYFRALTSKQQIELMNELSAALISYVTKRH